MYTSQSAPEPEHRRGKQAGVVLYSFGFKHGVPVDANLVLDVRFLPNPYWEEELRPMSGREQAVAEYVVNSEPGREFLRLVEPLLSFVLDPVNNPKRKTVRLAIGCTGGRHRSVAIVEELHRYLVGHGIAPITFHRDLERCDAP